MHNSNYTNVEIGTHKFWGTFWDWLEERLLKLLKVFSSIWIVALILFVFNRHRFLQEIYSLLQSPQYKEKLFIKNVKVHNSPVGANCSAWLGGKYKIFRYSVCGYSNWTRKDGWVIRDVCLNLGESLKWFIHSGVRVKFTMLFQKYCGLRFNHPCFITVDLDYLCLVSTI